jgi:hypothetical protein
VCLSVVQASVFWDVTGALHCYRYSGALPVDWFRRSTGPLRVCLASRGDCNVTLVSSWYLVVGWYRWCLRRNAFCTVTWKHPCTSSAARNMRSSCLTAGVHCDACALPEVRTWTGTVPVQGTKNETATPYVGMFHDTGMFVFTIRYVSFTICLCISLTQTVYVSRHVSLLVRT